MNTPSEAAVLAAADNIIRAFADTDTEAYFAGFASDATFIFHPEAARLDSREAYEQLWSSWLEAGWRVTACTSTDRLVQAFPGGAVFSHTVATSIDSNDGPDSYVERESIIFRADEDGSLTAIHEHLSTTPETEAAAS
ncbi:nuclear transport factor 2 family protein [Leucobacter coleopterorum]|uniref:Nuclear transport factor 2 family protein n=1 Tax=Leucobacter coleopterorum TaxID=2714933 RepID=A0ABX6JVP9_9MICO|nr:nuclear transport factor 2 family protein [Leucobacter coleopterorum]QIM18061.1 nuclear transport factor 2 family protein [Leucobacter coleopterorum]